MFATAYDQYAVRAFEVNAVDYLLKPFDRTRVQAAVERASARIAADSASAPGTTDAAIESQLAALLRLLNITGGVRRARSAQRRRPS